MRLKGDLAETTTGQDGTVDRAAGTRFKFGRKYTSVDSPPVTHPEAKALMNLQLQPHFHLHSKVFASRTMPEGAPSNYTQWQENPPRRRPSPSRKQGHVHLCDCADALCGRCLFPQTAGKQGLGQGEPSLEPTPFQSLTSVADCCALSLPPAGSFAEP